VPRVVVEAHGSEHGLVEWFQRHRRLERDEHGPFRCGHSAACDAYDHRIKVRALVGADGEVLAGSGPRHSGYPIRTEIMNARPDVGGVVHTHPPHAVALATTGQPLRPVSHAANFFIPPGIPRFTQTADLVLTRELGKAVAAELAAAPAISLVNPWDYLARSLA
jgi:hypothetical protein